MVNTILRYWDVEPELKFNELRYELPNGDSCFLLDPWDKLREKYGEGVYINPGTELEWREFILTLDNFEQSLEQEKDGIVSLTGRVIDSFTVQAQRRGVEKDYSHLETAIYCFTTDGERLLLGVRGGSESIGEIVGVPAGAVEFVGPYSNPHLIEEAVYKEANEEGGNSEKK